MLLTLLFQTLIGIPWDKMFAGGISFVILVLLLVVLLKLAPMWKEIHLKEIDSRDKESDARIAQSKALESVANVLYEVAVEQRRSSDSVKILQRVNSTKADELEAAISESLQAHEDRIMKLEKNATHISTAQPAAAH
jgi:hypothetical protein